MPNRNVESRFSLLPDIDIPRSRFDMSNRVLTTLNAGRLIPIGEPLEVLPGDTFDMTTHKVIRMQTLATPMYDNVYADFYHFFVPNRLVWEHWKNLQGENTESAWVPETVYETPTVVAPENGWSKGTIADYFGIPTGIENIEVSALPFRAYALICNEFFRDENLTQPLYIPVNDTQQSGSNGDSYVNDVVNGGMPFKVAKYHDYFTSALPSPQKGDSITLPISTISGQYPVYGNGTQVNGVVTTAYGSEYGSLFNGSSGNTIQLGTNTPLVHPEYYSGGLPSKVSGAGPIYFPTKEMVEDGDGASFLNVDLDVSMNPVTINDLRFAFQMQKALERDARSGTRYIESIKAFFGVTNPDYRLQRPEFLGGSRVPIIVDQIVQNSESSTTPLGTTGAYSLTTDSHDDFIYSFTEHGYIISLMCIRYDHTYQQGLSQLWTRRSRYDYYMPVFAAISEQPIFNREIMCQGPDVVNEDTGEPYDDEVFGYQEAWATYRYRNNIVTGEMRSNYAQSLDFWHLADDYSTLPTLSDGWIREDGSTINRVLAVSSNVADQFLMDCYLECYATRPMPLFSVPGLIDHF